MGLSLAITGATVAACHFYSNLRFGFSFSMASLLEVWAVFSGILIIAMFGLKRRLLLVLLIQLVVVLVLMAHQVKMAMLGIPIFYTDIYSAKILLRTAPTWAPVLVILVSTTLVGLLLFCVRRSWMTLWVGVVMTLYIALAIGSLSKVTPNSEADFNAASGQAQQLSAMGPISFILSDRLHYLAERQKVPSHKDASALVERVWPGWEVRPTRNIHLVLFEALWDVSAIANVSPDRDPLDPRFLSAWARNGRPYILTPVYGGGTANSEFEALCGMQSPERSIAFIGELKNRTACLPAVLGALGYTSMVSHPHEADNWNRLQSYDLIGFDEYRPRESFRLDDRDGEFLTDASLFSQNHEALLSHAGEGPIFNYVITLSTHWYYPKNGSRRPDLISIRPDSHPTYYRYVNSLLYSTVALMDWAEQTLKDDPNALIVVFGDHAPVISSTDDGITSSDAAFLKEFVFSREKLPVGDSTASVQLALSRAPLLVLGNHDPSIIQSDIPLYRLPALVARLLGSSHSLPQLDLKNENDPARVRRYMSGVLHDANGAWMHCNKSAQAGCESVLRKVRTRDRVRADVIYGSQFAYSAAGVSPLWLSKRGPMRVIESYAPCNLLVTGLGPRQVKAATGLKDGSLEIWVSYKGEARGRYEVEVAGEKGVVDYVEGALLVHFAAPAFLRTAGKKKVNVTCLADGEKKRYISDIIVH